MFNTTLVSGMLQFLLVVSHCWSGNFKKFKEIGTPVPFGHTFFTIQFVGPFVIIIRFQVKGVWLLQACRLTSSLFKSTCIRYQFVAYFQQMKYNVLHNERLMKDFWKWNANFEGSFENLKKRFSFSKKCGVPTD